MALGIFNWIPILGDFAYKKFFEKIPSLLRLSDHQIISQYFQLDIKESFYLPIFTPSPMTAELKSSTFQPQRNSH